EAEEFASQALELLVRGERAVHGASAVPHELGSADTIVDLAGAAALLESLELFDALVLSAPVNTGTGAVQTSHGRLAVPTPLVAEILRSRGIPFLSRHRGELTTPTGIALLACLAEEFARDED
ncbi:MAG: LarC family nickel insertion protein, partial [Euryarchaeota archaeon]|nr:LarC family nickel insertion protein [Euryarchaeota archaeon]